MDGSDVQIKPAGFMSYSRFDDKHDHGFLTSFRQRLGDEVRAQWGHKFEIFQDVADIGWGSDWQAMLDAALDSATFLIPVITPSFFGSMACRAEVETFDTHARRRPGSSLILPLYYISAPQFERFEQFKDDSVVSALRRHQFADWRELRNKSITDASVEEEISKLARRITDFITADPAERHETGPPRTLADGNGQLTSKTGAAASSGAAGRLRLVPSPERAPGEEAEEEEQLASPWAELLATLKRTKLEPADWRLFASRTKELREALAPGFPPYPAAEAEVSSVIEALVRAIGPNAIKNATPAQITSSCETAERLRLILIDLISKTR